ncbi:MAG: hypothetical protein PWQ64_1806 [Desulfomicrobiaceae bacterium]|jgi:dinuclear metal center YbgI/SA1388 family protein|nr:hypothetical protein [Desulfomicrobiaceae bacterium]MDK2874042.1 hypothetical protein [Desulfomicrobiaceae bacterium]HCF05615.1 Nif3-like dinuclear metal center hexameric protein [Desulfomicrobiaceae bacterium]
MHVHDLIRRIEHHAPPAYAATWDRCGVQVAARRETVSAVAVTLDPTPEAIHQAHALGCEFLLAHHPVALTPHLPDRLDIYHDTLQAALAADLWVYSAHTSLDANPDGPAGWLAQALGLSQIQVLEETFRQTPILCVLPKGRPQDVPQGITPVMATPGSTGLLLAVWPEDLDAIRAIASGPWVEAPLSAPVRTAGIGQVGDLPEPVSWETLRTRLEHWGVPCNRLVGQPPQRITRVAICPGSGASLGRAAFGRGAQVFITGDIKYHDAQALEPLGLTVDAGHFSLEEIMMRTWSEHLARELAPLGLHVHRIPGHDPIRMG